MTNTAAIYARLSVDRDEDKLGIDAQLKDSRDLADRLGWVVVEEYVDRGLTAADKLVVRPAYDRLVRDLGRGQFDALICWDLDRLTRQPRQLEDWIDAAEATGVRVVTANGEADLHTDQGQLFASMKVRMAKAEVRRASARIKRNVKARQESGKWHGGTVPYGYVRGESTLVPNQPEVTRILDAAKRILAGDSMQGIANEWNRLGLTTRGGKHWRNTNLRAILTNRSLLGETTIRDQNGKRIQGVKGWEPVIDQRTFDRLQRVFADPARKATHSPGVRGGKYSMGGGLTVCANCGAALITSSHHGRPSLRCTRIVNGPAVCGRGVVDHANLERYVFETVVAALEANPRWNQRLAEPDPDNDAKITKLEGERADLVEQQRRVNDAWILGNVDEPHYRTHVDRIKSELQSVERKINDLLGSTVMTDAIADGLDWQSWPAMRRRNFMRLAVRRIEVGPYPKGMPFGLPRRKSESDGEHEARRQAHINRVMSERVTIVV